MSHPPLFPELTEVEESSGPASLPIGELRLSRPVRNQVEMAMQELDALIGPEPRARAIWGLVERLALAAFYMPIRAATHPPGRAATNPEVLLALWLYATVEDVGRPGAWTACARSTTPTAGCGEACR